MSESMAGRAFRRKQKRKEIREEAHKKIKHDAQMHPKRGTRAWLNVQKWKRKKLIGRHFYE